LILYSQKYSQNWGNITSQWLKYSLNAIINPNGGEVSGYLIGWA
jgi:hypothetical protein